MLSKILSCATYGIEGYLVDVEVDLSNGLPGFTTVGLPDNAVKESKDRVFAAIKNAGFRFPSKKITVNLAPADIKKEGSKFDLPIAIGILTSMGVINQSRINDMLFIGELSLDGKIRPVNGILPIIHGTYKNNISHCIVPIDNANEAAIIKNTNIIGVDNLKELIEFLQEKKNIKLNKKQED